MEFSWSRFTLLDQFLYYSVPSLKPWDNRCTTWDRKQKMASSKLQGAGNKFRQDKSPLIKGCNYLLSCSSSSCGELHFSGAHVLPRFLKGLRGYLVMLRKHEVLFLVMLLRLFPYSSQGEGSREPSGPLPRDCWGLILERLRGLI